MLRCVLFSLCLKRGFRERLRRRKSHGNAIRRIFALRSLESVNYDFQRRTTTVCWKYDESTDFGAIFLLPKSDVGSKSSSSSSSSSSVGGVFFFFFLLVLQLGALFSVLFVVFVVVAKRTTKKRGGDNDDEREEERLPSWRRWWNRRKNTKEE